MREVKFSVNDQTLSLVDDLTTLIRGSKGSLKFKFDVKIPSDSIVIAVFTRGKEEYAVKLDDELSCVVPNQVMDYPCFNIKMVFYSSNGIVPTNKLLIKLEG